MKLVRFYIGFNDKDENIMKYNYDVYKQRVINVVNKYQSNYTIIKTEGHYYAERELGCIVEMIVNYDKIIAELCKDIGKGLKQSLNQECIMVTIQDIDCKFI